MNKHENDRLPRMLADEPDADELEAVWSALEVAHPDASFPPEKTDAAWEALSGKLGLRATDAPVIEADAPDHYRSSSRATARTGWLRVAAVAAVGRGRGLAAGSGDARRSGWRAGRRDTP